MKTAIAFALLCLPLSGCRPDWTPPTLTAQVHTYRLLPLEAIRLENSRTESFDVVSDFPVSVSTGDCRAVRVLQIHCRAIAGGKYVDLVIRDIRIPASQEPHPNVITVTGHGYY